MTRNTAVRYGFVIYGMVMATGIFFVFIPRQAMVRIGELWQLPPFEISPVFEYMARWLSFIAFLCGLMLFYFARHFSEMGREIRLIGWMALATVPVAVWIHASAETPLWWAAGDIAGLIILFGLCRLCPKGGDRHD